MAEKAFTDRFVQQSRTKVGTVDHLEGENQLKLTKDENDQHHLIPTSWIGEVKEDQVILNKNSEEVKENWQAI
ncbi:DUF2171 domain-containing protein [Acinetobacter baumannii]|nr:DUF2171 domain-containing protein [Acinetobacter baumannii]